MFKVIPPKVVRLELEHRVESGFEGRILNLCCTKHNTRNEEPWDLIEKPVLAT